MIPSAPDLRLIAERAAELIRPGNVVGLGSGRAAMQFIERLGELVREGLTVRGVPTSLATADLADRAGIPLTDLGAVEAIDITVDGADEVDNRGNLIKGLGGALVREKIVAAASRQLIILVGSEKLVPALGTRGVLPVEVVPFGLEFCQRRLAALGLTSNVRLREGRPFVTDNGNRIVDCRVAPLENPAELERTLQALPGVVGTGLFLGMSPTVVIQTGTDVEIRPGVPQEITLPPFPVSTHFLEIRE